MENLRDKKGRFKSRKQLAKLEQASILRHSTLRNNEKEMESSIEDFEVGVDVETENDEEWSGPDLKFINLEGNRIIEFERLTNILNQGCYKCQKNLITRIFNKTKYGLGSIFKVSCKYCLAVNKIITSSTIGKGRTGHGSFEVNTKMALGMVDACLGRIMPHRSFLIWAFQHPTRE